MLENHNDIYNHDMSIQALLIKVFKMKNELAPQIMESMLNTRFMTHNLSNFHEFVTKRGRTAWYDLETLTYRASQLWLLLPGTYKETNFLSQFKRNVRQCLQ